MDAAVYHVRIRMKEETLKRFIIEVFGLLNPDDWWFLETTLRYTGENFTKNTELCFRCDGPGPHRFKPRKFAASVRSGNLQSFFPLSYDKPPEIIYIHEENLLSVCQITEHFLRRGYELVYLRARTGYEDYAYGSPGILLTISFPNFDGYEPMIEIISRKSETEDFSFITEKIICLLKSKGSFIRL